MKISFNLGEGVCLVLEFYSVSVDGSGYHYMSCLLLAAYYSSSYVCLLLLVTGFQPISIKTLYH